MAELGLGIIVEWIVQVYLVLYLLPGLHQGLDLRMVEQEIGQVLLLHLLFLEATLVTLALDRWPTVQGLGFRKRKAWAATDKAPWRIGVESTPDIREGWDWVLIASSIALVLVSWVWRMALVWDFIPSSNCRLDSRITWIWDPEDRLGREGAGAAVG